MAEHRKSGVGRTLGFLKKEMVLLGDPRRSKNSAWFFKTQKGQYGEGDTFLGIKVPTQRVLAKKYRDLPTSDVFTLLKSPVHEHRLTALFILRTQYEKSEEKGKSFIAKQYVRHIKHYVNNWDLVDSSAPYILGEYVCNRPRTILFTLAKSGNVWERRVAILSTSAFIKRNEFKDTLAIARIMLLDSHDLIHKAVGWMLREVGNRNRKAEEVFLRRFSPQMPRTMLRYAIEKFPMSLRRKYLSS